MLAAIVIGSALALYWCHCYKPTAADATTMINSQDYVLVDATGSALLAVGEISPQYRLYMSNDQTDYRLF